MTSHDDDDVPAMLHRTTVSRYAEALARRIDQHILNVMLGVGESEVVDEMTNRIYRFDSENGVLTVRPL